MEVEKKLFWNYLEKKFPKIEKKFMNASHSIILTLKISLE